ncbi:hypothetical protein Syun_014827 [Stephania yunnanensis]|uniref:At2g29880-like C-terminal domain-containing protein n=1 Tax=Stephania yunnanensis TaxID=152371 RepID=A0AAP0JMD1_9MAGN
MARFFRNPVQLSLQATFQKDSHNGFNKELWQSFIIMAFNEKKEEETPQSPNLASTARDQVSSQLGVTTGGNLNIEYMYMDLFLYLSHLDIYMVSFVGILLHNYHDGVELVANYIKENMTNPKNYMVNAIVARPSSTYKGYLLCGLVWFAVPFSLATSLGLAALALDLPITANEASHGIVPPAAATALMGNGGSIFSSLCCLCEYYNSKSHPNQRHYQTDTFTDYDDLRIIVGNATASGRYSIGLGDDTDARIFEEEETSGDVLEYLTYDYDAEVDRFMARDQGWWKLIKEIPYLRDSTRFKVLELLNTRAKKIDFMEMSSEERSKWIAFQLT